MANDFAGAYDMFALTLGAQCLRDRILTENTSPLGARGKDLLREQPVTRRTPQEDDRRLA